MKFVKVFSRIRKTNATPSIDWLISFYLTGCWTESQIAWVSECLILVSDTKTYFPLLSTSVYNMKQFFKFWQKNMFICSTMILTMKKMTNVSCIHYYYFELFYVTVFQTNVNLSLFWQENFMNILQHFVPECFENMPVTCKSQNHSMFQKFSKTFLHYAKSAHAKTINTNILLINTAMFRN